MEGPGYFTGAPGKIQNPPASQNPARITVEVLCGIIAKLIESSGGKNIRAEVAAWAGQEDD
jgi:hypothetical protein